MEITEQQFVDACKEHRLMVARRIRSNALKTVRGDVDFKIPTDCSREDAITYAKVFQQRLREVLEAIDEGFAFAGK